MSLTSKYLTEPQLLARISEEILIQLTDDTNTPPSTIDYAVLNEIIADAEDTVAAHLMGRYPEDTLAGTTNAFIRGLTCAIVHHRLHQRRGRLPQDVSATFDAAIQTLEEISIGRQHVPGWVAQSTSAFTCYDANMPACSSLPWEQVLSPESD